MNPATSLAQKPNQQKQLVFSGPHIRAVFVETVRDFYVGHRNVVINPNTSFVEIDEQPRAVIAPLSSTVLRDTTVKSADSLILLETVDATNIGNIILEDGWSLYGDLIKDSLNTADPAAKPFPLNTPLWRSLQDSLGVFKINPYAMTGQSTVTPVEAAYLIKTNLWFAPSGTNCFIHNQHDFIEIHTQIFGHGRMQKFKAQDYTTLFEDILMSLGFTTPVPFCSIQDSKTFKYPWHQYYADTDCIWLAIEYHPAGD